jgi:hypothetical protein
VRPGQWSYTVRYDDSAPVKGVKIAGQSGELDARKLNQDVSDAVAVCARVGGGSAAGKLCVCVRGGGCHVRMACVWLAGGP